MFQLFFVRLVGQTLLLSLLLRWTLSKHFGFRKTFETEKVNIDFDFDFDSLELGF